MRCGAKARVCCQGLPSASTVMSAHMCLDKNACLYRRTLRRVSRITDGTVARACPARGLDEVVFLKANLIPGLCNYKQVLRITLGDATARKPFRTVNR